MFAVKKSQRRFATEERGSASRAALGVLLIVAFWLLEGCGNQVEPPEPEPDPMELTRYYAAPDWQYQLDPAVRLVNPTTPRGDRKPMIIASNVYRLPDAAAAAAEVGEDEIELDVEGREFLLNRQVGDIVISEKNGVLWRRIKEISVDDGKLRWRTEPAKVNEVFQKAHFYLQIDTSKVNPDRLPELDLALPYLEPNEPPALLQTRTSAMHDGGDCPKAPPECEAPPVDEGKVCVLASNPEVACPLKLDDRCKSMSARYNCVERPSCVVNNGDLRTMEACPEGERSSCSTMGGACRPVITCDLRAAVNFYSTDHDDAPLPNNTDVRFPVGYEPFGDTDFQCVELAGRNVCVVKECSKGDTTACTSDFAEAGPDHDRAYACNLDDLTLGECTESGLECSNSSDCCSRNCADVRMPAFEPNGEPRLDENGDQVIEIARQCQPAEQGFCSRACNNESVNPEYEDDGLLASLLKQLILDEAQRFIKDFTFDANFKPDISFELEIDWFTVERLGLTVGADFLTRFGISFQWELDEDYDWQGEKEINIFSFAIFGYPFHVKLHIHGKILLTVSGSGSFEPEYVLYTHKESGEEWTEDNNRFGGWRDTYSGAPLPGVWDSSSGDPGMGIGMIWSKSSPCGDYSGWECERAKEGSKFYKLQRNITHDIFDPGAKADLDASASAQFGLQVALWEGSPGGSKIIGIEPINLLGSAYATIHTPFCAIGASLYYRMFLVFGPLRFFGQEVLGEIKFPILVKQIFGLNWLIPQDLGCDGTDEQSVLCDLANTVGCGLPSLEEAPPASPSTCDGSTDCAVDERCVNATCVSQPDGALRISLFWPGRDDLDLHVQPLPSGQTLSKTPALTSSNGSCGAQGCFEPSCGGPNAAAPANGQGIDCSIQDKFVESLVIEQPTAERYKIWVINNGSTNSATGGSFTIGIEHGDHVEEFGGQLPASGIQDTEMTPLYFIYEVPTTN